MSMLARRWRRPNAAIGVSHARNAKLKGICPWEATPWSKQRKVYMASNRNKTDPSPFVTCTKNEFNHRPIWRHIGIPQGLLCTVPQVSADFFMPYLGDLRCIRIFPSRLSSICLVREFQRESGRIAVKSSRSRSQVSSRSALSTDFGDVDSWTYASLYRRVVDRRPAVYTYIHVQYIETPTALKRLGSDPRADGKHLPAENITVGGTFVPVGRAHTVEFKAPRPTARLLIQPPVPMSDQSPSLARERHPP